MSSSSSSGSWFSSWALRASWGSDTRSNQSLKLAALIFKIDTTSFFTKPCTKILHWFIVITMLWTNVAEKPDKKKKKRCSPELRAPSRSCLCAYTPALRWWSTEFQPWLSSCSDALCPTQKKAAVSSISSVKWCPFHSPHDKISDVAKQFISNWFLNNSFNNSWNNKPLYFC